MLKVSIVTNHLGCSDRNEVQLCHYLFLYSKHIRKFALLMIRLGKPVMLYYKNDRAFEIFDIPGEFRISSKRSFYLVERWKYFPRMSSVKCGTLRVQYLFSLETSTELKIETRGSKIGSTKILYCNVFFEKSM